MKKCADKIVHFLLSAFIVCFLMVILKDVVLPIIITLLIGICKEMYDEFREGGTGANWWDFLADALGVATGVIIFLTT